MPQLSIKQWFIAVTLLIAVAILTFLPSLWSGLSHAESYYYNIHWFESFAQQLDRGERAPRWLNALWDNAGASDFFFYAPLPFYTAYAVGSPLCFTCGPEHVFIVGQAAILAVSGVSFLLLALDFVSFGPALASAMLYLILPNHIGFTWYFRQTVGEFAAYAIVPLLVLSYRRMETRTPLSGVSLCACFALLCVTHLPSLITASCFIGFCIGGTAITHRESPRFAMGMMVRVAMYGTLAMASTAVYWLPAVSLLSDVSPEQFARDGMLGTQWLFFDGVPEHEDIVNFALAVKTYLIIGTIIVGISSFRIRQLTSDTRLWMTLPVLTTWFFNTPLSYLLWKYAPILPAIQFPYRFMVIFDIGIGLAFAQLAAHWLNQKTTTKALPLICIGLIFYIHNVGWAYAFDRSHFPADYQEWHDEGRAVRFGTLEYQPESSVLHCRDIMVNRTRLQQFVAIPEIRIIDGDAERLTLTQHTSRAYSLTLTALTPSTVVLKRFYWTHWVATDRDTQQRIPVSPHPDDGLMEITVPPGTHTIDFTLPTLAPERHGANLSLIGLIAFFVVAMANRRRR